MLQKACPVWPEERQLYADVYSFFRHVREEGIKEILDCKSSSCTKQAAVVNSLTMGMKERKKIASLSVHRDKMGCTRRKAGLQRSTGWC